MTAGITKAVLITLSVAAVAGAAIYVRQQPPPSQPQAFLTSQGKPAIAKMIEAEPRAPGCDGMTAHSPLPKTLTVPTPTIEAIVDAIDRVVPDDQKQYVRCSRDEGDLIARTHFGMGEWLRTTMRLWSKNDLTAAFRARGITNADDASSVLLRIYFHKLKGEPLATDDVIARVKAESRQ
jgi:hypothetical protein